MSGGSRVWRRFRRNPVGMIAVFLLLATILIAVAAPLIAPYPTGYGEDLLVGPSGEHWFGTDDLGRDTFARVLYGGRVSLVIGLFSAALSVVLGMTIGMLAGFFGGALDEVLMRITEAFQILPKLLVAVVVGKSALRSACFQMMRIGPAPLARARSQ